MKIVILWKASDVAPFVEIVRTRADAEKRTLGFFPKRVYREAAEQEKLVVVVASSDTSETYAGHLLFGGIFPLARVFQIFVDPRFRRQGIGKKLVQAIVRKSQASHYLSISARVARDLGEANAFWDQMGFKLVRTKRGGKSRGRLINIRARRLETPSLFDLLDPSTTRPEPDLRLVERLSSRAPVYVIDLNVLFDITKRRSQAELAGRILRAGFENLIRLAVADEFIAELRRSSEPSSTDPILELALQLPRLPKPRQQEIEKTLTALAGMIFPQRMAEGRLSPQDRSDLLHLATAIYHRTEGFITSEKAILRARNMLQSEYGIDIIGVAEFAQTFQPIPSQHPTVVHALPGGTEIRASDLSKGDLLAAREFLEQMYVPSQLCNDALSTEDFSATARRVLVRSGMDVIAYASWNVSHGPKHVTDVFICADEDHLVAETVVDFLINRICTDASESGPALIRLRELPGHVVTLRTALAHGFRSADRHAPRGSTLQKVSVGRPIDAESWGRMRLQLKTLVGIDLPRKMPDFESPQQPLCIGSPSGCNIEIPIRDLESLVSPVLFVFQSRDGVIVPIRRVFADDLLGASPQLSLLALPEAGLLRERAYFSSPRNLSLLAEGSPMVFYESGAEGGRASAIAVARIVNTHLMLKRDVSPSVRRRGVVEATTLEHLSTSATVAATTFDNIMPFKRPVPFRRLREIGCVDRANLVTARRLSGEHLTHILRESEAYA